MSQPTQSSRVTASFNHGNPTIRFGNDSPVPADAAAVNRARAVRPNLLPRPLGLAPSFGFGDRLGLATPGHVAAMRVAGQSAGIQPIFAQQSIREMTRTQRTPRQVMDDATLGTLIADWDGIVGADADHLKTTADIDATAAVGFCFFTLDPSGEVDARADDYAPAQLEEAFKKVAGEVAWLGEYTGKGVKLPGGSAIALTDAIVKKAAVKYGRAINLATRLSDHAARVMGAAGQSWEIELSVDETPQPTTLAEHYIIADQCLKRGMKLVSLAPRFIGDFEKGVDYKGDLTALERSLAEHAAIAEMLGPYKLSLHSGSDKLSLYPMLARKTHGRFHVKTAGTSYLEALRVVCRLDPALFRRIVEFSRNRYATDKATYHVSATLESAPPASDLKDARALEKAYLGLWSDAQAGTGLSDPGRQILHCTFGSVLTDATLKAEVMGVLKAHTGAYEEILADHFGRHLKALAAGM
jgi:tagaturonate epimerase